MNILFRKNFAEGGGGSKDRGGLKRTGPRGKQRKRETEDSSNLRTHIFLRTGSYGVPGGTAPWVSEETGTGIACSGWDLGWAEQTQISTHQTALLCKAPSEVSFCGNGNSGGGSKTPISLRPVPKADPSDLKTLDKDCFIIPVANVDRFLPAGVPMPLVEAKSDQGISVLEVDDPKLVVLIHLMSPLEPIEPMLESPLAAPALKQSTAASDLLHEVASSNTTAEAMLLANIEKNAEFPFISYYVINKVETDPREFFQACRAASLRKFDPRALRYTVAHTFDLFAEVATIARPPLDPTHSKRPRTHGTAFIVSVYKVFEGDDGEKFEKNWLYWTGARMIYKSLPKSAGLRRITLHKSQSHGDKLYLLLVECSNLLHDLAAAAFIIPALRARLCGYTGLYRTTALC